MSLGFSQSAESSLSGFGFTGISFPSQIKHLKERLEVTMSAYVLLQQVIPRAARSGFSPIPHAEPVLAAFPACHSVSQWVHLLQQQFD